jgi:four helix bundle protein
MTPQELQDRTFQFAVDVFNVVRPLFRNCETRHVADQLVRASTSAASNYRAAGRGRSRREFCSKLGTVREESDESLFWLLFMDAVKLATPRSRRLTLEARELAAIFAAAYRTAKQRLRQIERERRLTLPLHRSIDR